MSYFSNIANAITTLMDGMKVTMGYFVRPREHVTLQYPDEVWPIPSRNIGVGELDSYNTIRSKLTVNIDDCIGCKACERACPVDCINIDTYKGTPEDNLQITSNGTQVKLLVASFTIDMSECMFCDLCTPPCPEDCITMTPDYQFISNDNLNTDVTQEERWRNKDLLIYQFSKVSEDERQRRKAAAEEAAKEKAALMAAKKAAKAKADEEKAAKAAMKAGASVSAEVAPTQPPSQETEVKVDVPLDSITTNEPKVTPSETTAESSKAETPADSEISTTEERENG